MTSTPHAGPVNLDDCDKEPIHLLGRIQPFGFLMGFSPDWTISHVSENAAGYFGMPAARLLGRHASDVLSGNAIHQMRNSLQMLRGRAAVEVLDDLKLTEDGEPLDISLHVSDSTVVIECETVRENGGDQSGIAVRRAIQNLSREVDPRRVARMAAMFVAGEFRFDKVMVYRFMQDGSGEVIAEVCPPSMEPYLNLRFPASDIPKQARALYLKAPIRLIADAGEQGVPVLAAGKDGETLDLTLSVLRSVSPVHLEYLRNMGVGASMSISIIVDGKLWGLIACHQKTPKTLTRRQRNAADLFGQMFSLLLQARLNDDVQQVDQKVDELVAGMSLSLSPEQSLHEALLGYAESFAPMVDAEGWAVVMGGQCEVAGATPPKAFIEDLLPVVKQGRPGRVFASSCLSDLLPEAAAHAAVSAGVLALPISKIPGDYVLFFRREVVKAVKWAGNPDKATEASKDGTRISPRTSFAVWQQNVKGHSEDWSPQDIRAANQLRLALLEIVLRLAEEVARERQASQEKQELVVSELNHRMRNILGLVRGLIAQSSPRSGNTADFVTILDSRIQALARAHDQLTRENWSPASLKDLISVEAESYLMDRRNRVDVTGNDIALSPVAFSTFALVIHELMTNSLKYGALSDSSGDVKVTIRQEEGQPLIFQWEEKGGPAVKPPSRRGFGSTVIERSIPFELKGRAEVDFAPGGLRAQFEVPVSHVHELLVRDIAADERHVTEEISQPSPASVLIVEDNLIIAMDAEAIFRQLGAKEVYLASTNEEAAFILSQHKVDFVLLDVNLGSATSYSTAQRLMELTVPFAFASGYGDDGEAPHNLRDRRSLPKPYFLESVKRLLVEMQEQFAR